MGGIWVFVVAAIGLGVFALGSSWWNRLGRSNSENEELAETHGPISEQDEAEIRRNPLWIFRALWTQFSEASAKRQFGIIYLIYGAFLIYPAVAWPIIEFIYLLGAIVFGPITLVWIFLRWYVVLPGSWLFDMYLGQMGNFLSPFNILRDLIHAAVIVLIFVKFLRRGIQTRRVGEVILGFLAVTIVGQVLLFFLLWAGALAGKV